MAPEELRYALLKAIETEPETNQRSLSAELGVSVGRVNAGLRQLVDCGLLVITERGPGRAQRYDISPLGRAEQTVLARVFIKRKQDQREQLRREIEALRADLATNKQQMG
ncbi:winged helix-turn-helix transcriptional regulator [Aquisalimonas sp.]|uniref:winged helix-turn-helix transcriptional regulator n=1 Tax=Aquisalimonas sp. TaxID=1872621 RepID=UPI0025C13D6C|nr:winged helix-turn-helix transcriptional regulator [Aquisalimonas sp.]